MGRTDLGVPQPVSGNVSVRLSRSVFLSAPVPCPMAVHSWLLRVVSVLVDSQQWGRGYSGESHSESSLTRVGFACDPLLALGGMKYRYPISQSSKTFHKEFPSSETTHQLTSQIISKDYFETIWEVQAIFMLFSRCICLDKLKWGLPQMSCEFMI